MARSADHTARRKQILGATIEIYLNSAQPVSSDSLRKSHRIDLSSASVRNVFSELEEMGFLMHPHISAGRIPTDEGYRFYLNVLMEKRSLQREEADFIDKIYELKVSELDDLLSETSKLISDFTHYASIVYFDEDEKTYFQGMRYILDHPEFKDIQRAHAVVEALETKEALLELIKRGFSDRTCVYIGKESHCPQMEYCSVVVSKYKSRDKKDGRLALIGPKRMAYDKVIPLMDYVAEVMQENFRRF